MAGKGSEKKKTNCLKDVRKCGTQDESKLIHIFFFRSLFPAVKLYPDLFSWSFSRVPGFLEARAGRRLGLVV